MVILEFKCIKQAEKNCLKAGFYFEKNLCNSVHKICNNVKVKNGEIRNRIICCFAAKHFCI